MIETYIKCQCYGCANPVNPRQRVYCEKNGLPVMCWGCQKGLLNCCKERLGTKSTIV